jgi:hypothetical protein
LMTSELNSLLAAKFQKVMPQGEITLSFQRAATL